MIVGDLSTVAALEPDEPSIERLWSTMRPGQIIVWDLAGDFRARVDREAFLRSLESRSLDDAERMRDWLEQPFPAQQALIVVRLADLTLDCALYEPSSDDTLRAMTSAEWGCFAGTA